LKLSGSWVDLSNKAITWRQHPEGYLNLGIAYSLIGKTEEAILELDKTVSLDSDYNIMELEKEKDSNAEDYYFECHLIRKNIV